MKDDEEDALQSASSALVGEVVVISLDSVRLRVIPPGWSCSISSSSSRLTTSTSSIRG
jgi:hypothetical protein